MNILVKAQAVLLLLARVREATTKEIAEAIEEPVSSTYRLLRNLLKLGWIESAGRRGRYRLGTAPIHYGRSRERHVDLRVAADPYLRDLNQRTGRTVLLYEFRGVRAVCVEHLDGTALGAPAVSVGDELPRRAGAKELARQPMRSLSGAGPELGALEATVFGRRGDPVGMVILPTLGADDALTAATRAELASSARRIGAELGHRGGDHGER